MGLAIFDFGRWFRRKRVQPEAPEPPAQLNRDTGQRELILIVEDSKTVQSLLAKMLHSAGYRTLAAYDGERGVEMAKEHRPALLLMDLVMPGMTGFQATRKIRKIPELATLPIIIMSGNEQATEQFYSKRIGANGFMAKPFSRTEVISKIGGLLQPPTPSAAAGM